jgi:Tetratricopeptide repeat
MLILHVTVRPRRPMPMPMPAGLASPMTEPSTARAWLDSERVNLVSVAAHTAEHGWCRHTTQLAAILSRYLDAVGHYPEAVTIHGHARRAARRSGDHSAEAAALTSLGPANFRQDRYRPAASHLQQALGLHRQTGDRVGQAQDQQAPAHDGTYPAPEPQTAAVDAVSRPGPARS